MWVVIFTTSSPAIGAPTNDVIPWQRTIIPNALVSLCKPIKSTRIMDLSDTNDAVKEKWKTFWKHS